MSKLNKIFSAAALTFAMIGNASATVVYENGTDGNFNGGNNPFTYSIVSQSFTIAAPANVTSFTYNAFTTASTLPVSNVFLEFSQNGNTIFSDNLSVAASNVIGSGWGYSFTDYTVNLPSLAMNAGEYLLSIQVAPNQWDMHWSMIDDGTYYFRLEADDSAVPEPSSIALLLLGVAGVAAARRKYAQK